MPSEPSSPSHKRYGVQHRGDRGAYDRYLKSMDASMKQKIALTAAHLLAQGKVADMGMGSATGSEALASLYPSLEVVGVDINPTMVERASERYKLPNLSFITGDIAKSCFEAGSLDGIFNSSVLHHVTTFSNYDHEAAGQALAVQVQQLRTDGIVIVRDFLAPSHDQEVFLDVLDKDGDDSDDPKKCSMARLLERFSREFRPLLDKKGGEKPGFPLAKIGDHSATDLPGPPLKAGFTRFKLSLRHAIEFLLRKDYKRDWDTEVLEEYLFYTREQFEESFESLGLRPLASTPIRNPWIIRNRFENQYSLWTLSGEALDHPATNYVIVGEKVAADRGVRIQEGGAAPTGSFLSLDYYKSKKTGLVMDLVRRPYLTVDVLPWFEVDGDLFVLARKSYPRPIIGCKKLGNRPVDGSTPAVYITEPLSVLQDDKPLGQTVEEALARLASVSSEDIKAFAEGSHYYPSPGGIQEEVRSLLVEIEPSFVQKDIENLSGFSTSGQVRALETQQALRSAQVSGLPNNRLEMNIYELLLRSKRSPGLWIGETVSLDDGDFSPKVQEVKALAGRPARRCFERSSAEHSKRFLELHCVRFDEFAASGEKLTEKVLEFVVPRSLSDNTVAVALLCRRGDRVFLGLDDDDLPAAQCFTGNSHILVSPAWRMPRRLCSMTPAKDWVRGQLRQEYGVKAGKVWELGGYYHPSPGVTPEIVYPVAVQVLEESEEGRPLTWVDLWDAVNRRDLLPDGHLSTLIFRAAHALGYLDEVRIMEYCAE